MFSSDYLSLTEQGHVATVDFSWDNPADLPVTLLDDWLRLLNFLEDESPCKLIVLRGLDRREKPTGATPPDPDLCRKWEKTIHRIEQFAGASIACIDGYCGRFHLQLAIACDFRIATTRSVFHAPEVTEGFLPGMNLFRLAKLTGMGAARQFILAGNPWPAAEALTLGLIDESCDRADLEYRLQQTQKNLQTLHPDVFRNARRLLNESWATTYEQAVGHFLAAQNLCLTAKR